MRTLDYSIWITANALCAVVLGIGFRKKYLSSLPVFFSYMGFSVCSTLFFGILILRWGAFPRIAAVSDWLGLACSIQVICLELAVIYELWNKVVLSRSSLANIFRPLPRWSAAVILFLAAIIAALFPQSAPGRAWKLDSSLSVAMDVMNVTWLVVLLTVSRAVGVSWGNMCSGIALGLAISDMGDAAGWIVLNHVHNGYYLDFVQQGSNLLAGVVWVTGIVRYAKSEKVQNTRARVSEEALAASVHLVEMLDV